MVMVEDILDAILRWVIDLLRETSLALYEQIIAAGFLLIPPWVTGAAEVIADRFRLLVVICYALIVCIGALMVMASDNFQSTYSAREIIPRLVAGFVLALMSWEIVTTLANLNNAVVLALVFGSSSESVPEDGTALGELVQEMLVPWDLSQMLFVELLTNFLQIVAILMLFVAMIGRNIAWFLVALLSPIALAAHGLPFTEGAAYLWWRMAFACMASSLGQSAILWTWQNLFQGLTDTDVAINYTLKPFYSLILVWLIWRVHKMAFLWARGRPARVPGARLLKTVASALVVGTILKSNPLGKLAKRFPLINRIPGLKRFFSPSAQTKTENQTARAQRPSAPGSQTRSSQPWRQRTNTDGPNGANRLHTHGPGQDTCPHCAPVRKRKSGAPAKSKQPTPSRGRKQGGRANSQQRGDRGKGGRGANSGGPQQPKQQRPNNAPAGGAKAAKPPSGAMPADSLSRAHHSALPQKPVPPDRRPQWPTPPVRHESQKRPPAWQPPPIRRPGYRKDESQ